MMLRMGMVSGGSVKTKYRYLRLTVDNTIGATYAGFYDLRYSADGGATIAPANMTSDSTPSPLVASASSIYGANYHPYGAFDSPQTTRWTSLTNSSANAWIQIDLGSGNEIALNWVSYRVINPSGGINDISPTAITVSGSNDGTSFDQLLRKTGLTSQPDGTNVTWTW